VQPFEVMLIHAVLDHLQEIAMDDSSAERAHAIVAHKNIVARRVRDRRK
jgi:hypothetical protein